MDGFKLYLEDSEEADVHRTLEKVPKAFTDLIKGYKFIWEKGNCLKGDNNHIGIIDPMTKTITIAAPWNYGREFTLLHELGHKVYEKFMTPQLLQVWQKIINNTSHKQNQNAEELWCQNFANYFAKNKIEIHNHPQWHAFMQKFVQMIGS